MNVEEEPRKVIHLNEMRTTGIKWLRVWDVEQWMIFGVARDERNGT